MSQLSFRLFTPRFVAAVLGTLIVLEGHQAAQADGPRLFEMRVYTTNDGKLEALQSRFRDHTCKLFEKHGMDLVGFWVPTDEERSQNTLIYILAYPDKAARDKSWEGFINDPDWKAAYADSIKDGRLVKKVDATFMTPTDYSQIK